MEEKSKDSDKSDKPKVQIKTMYDYQRHKLEKLMKNPEKPIVIPERQKDKKSPHVPDFVRNVMGSSAGAGSGEFHVYRHLRRKEYARQKHIQEKSEKELLDEEFQNKIQHNRQKCEERTAKKRAKRLKRKMKLKNKPKKIKPEDKKDGEEEESENSSEENESGEEKEEIDDKNETKDIKEEETKRDDNKSTNDKDSD